MKKNILLIFSILVCATTSVAQVREFQIGAQEDNIVRTVKGDSVLFYTRDASEDSWFVLYDESNASAKAFLFDVGLKAKVFDLRINDEKTAYFCGTIDLGGVMGNRGIVGFFNVADVFSGIGSVQWGLLYDDYSNQDFYPMELYRLDLFEVSGNVCMAMTGKVNYSGIGAIITTVLSAYYDGSSWHSWAMAHKGDVGFTDIACLDNLVVATGTYYADTGCFVKTFQPTLSFPIDYFSPTQTFHFTYGRPAGTVLIAKEKVDTAMIAHFDISSGVSTVLHKAPFDAGTGQPILPMGALKTRPPLNMSFDTNWRMRELTVVNDETFLLQKSAFPPEPSVSFQDWRLKTIVPYSTTIEGWTPPDGIQQSMDVVKAMKTSSCSLGNYLYLRMHGPNWMPMTTGCYIHSVMEVDSGSVGAEKFVLDPIDVEIVTAGALFPPIIISITENLICE